MIGGGLTGLTATFRLGELAESCGRRLEIDHFEAGPRLGGVMGTLRIGDYLVETGADSFITNKPWAVDLCRRLGLEERLIPTDARYRRSLVLKDGKPVPVPEGFMLLAPARIGPVVRSPLFTLRGKLRLGLEYFVPRRRDGEDESLASFVRRRFGREALERLVQPLVGGIYTSDPERLSLRATMPRFLDMEQQDRSLIRASRRLARQQAVGETEGGGARYGLFASLKDGISELLDALAMRVREIAHVHLQARVRKLERSRETGRYCLALEDETVREYDAVILAVPAYRAGAIVSQIDSELADALQAIEYASSAIVVTGHRLADVADPLNAFGLVIPAIERRKILAVSFASRKFPGRAPEGRVVLRTFVGGALQPEELDRSDAELIELVEQELRDILGVSGSAEFAHVARYDRAMPQYHVGHVERVQRIEQLASAHPGLEFAGNAYGGVGIPDCIQSGSQAAERILPSIAASPPTTVWL